VPRKSEGGLARFPRAALRAATVAQDRARVSRRDRPIGPRSKAAERRSRQQDLSATKFPAINICFDASAY
jgi:hypothetical protein